MNPEDPESAHRIVSDYARLLERDDRRALPASVRSLPYPKQTIKLAILTCHETLRLTQQLTPDMHEFLEEAYVALADYVDDDLARVMSEYRDALASVSDVRLARDKVQTAAWRTVAETGRLAGEVARLIAQDTHALRSEFRARSSDQIGKEELDNARFRRSAKRPGDPGPA